MVKSIRSRNLVKLSKDKKFCGFNYSLLRGVLFILTISLFFAYSSTQNTDVLIVFIIFAALLGLELFSTVTNHYKEVNRIEPEEMHADPAAYAVYIPAACAMETTTCCMDANGCAMHENVNCVHAHSYAE